MVRLHIARADAWFRRRVCFCRPVPSHGFRRSTDSRRVDHLLRFIVRLETLVVAGGFMPVQPISNQFGSRDPAGRLSRFRVLRIPKRLGSVARAGCLKCRSIVGGLGSGGRTPDVDDWPGGPH